MNRIFEIEGVEPGTKLLMCEVSDRSAIRVAVEVNGVKVGISLDKRGYQDLFSLNWKLDIVEEKDVGTESESV